ncbi:MAG TPA: hypothetical protein VMD09_18315 [Solirubrobacteraceae bacterium]|nr:hypothetical protein [Solirubrobacteraceae bacterium]
MHAEVRRGAASVQPPGVVVVDIGVGAGQQAIDYEIGEAAENLIEHGMV